MASKPLQEQLPIEDFTPPEADPTPVVLEQQAEVSDRRERVGHLLRALDFLAQESKYIGYKTIEKTAAGQAKLKDQYDGHAPIVSREVSYQVNNSRSNARDSFMRAFLSGMDVKDDADYKAIENDLEEEFTAFHQAYGGGPSRGAKRRTAFKKQLQKELKTMDPNWGPVVGDTYTTVIAPERELTVDEQLELLDTQGRMEAIRDDPRAGFLPKTNDEKNHAFDLLEFRMKDRHPGGIYEQLRAISDRRVRESRETMTYPEAKKEGPRAVKSVLNQYGDYLSNAQQSYINLLTAKRVLENTVNPAITLQEVLDENPDVEGLTFDELIRYIDLFDLREKGEATREPIDPLRVIENRTQPTEAKNKVIEDLYTTTQPRDVFEVYKQAQRDHIRVVTARKVIDAALEDELKRIDFWDASLHSVAHRPYKDMAQEVLEAS